MKPKSIENSTKFKQLLKHFLFFLVLVNCMMTIDNEVKQVFYNGNPVKVGGDLSDWWVLKRFSYNKTAGGELKISGYNIDDFGCYSGGLLLACDDGLISDANNWKAFGSSGEAPLSKSDYSKPCVSSSPFGSHLKSLTSTSAQKIWPSNGKNFAWFSVIPRSLGKHLRFLQGI